MKRSLHSFLFIALLLISSNIFAQQEPQVNKEDANKKYCHGRAGVGLGTRVHRYPYPITDLSFRVVVFNNRALFDTRLRAYGIKSIFGGRNYDLTAYVHKAWSLTNDVTYYVGGGAELMLRINGDDRSQATSGVQPMLLFGSMYYSGKFQFNFPLWTKFYRNGISLSILPEPSYKVSEKVQLFVRYELDVLALYNGTSHEWRHNALLGTYVYF